MQNEKFDWQHISFKRTVWCKHEGKSSYINFSLFLLLLFFFFKDPDFRLRFCSMVATVSAAFKHSIYSEVVMSLFLSSIPACFRASLYTCLVICWPLEHLPWGIAFEFTTWWVCLLSGISTILVRNLPLFHILLLIKLNSISDKAGM